jgi:peptidoglycan/LPS O-acetylase OafA/YrhL
MQPVAPKPLLTELTSARFIAAMAVVIGHFADMLALPPIVARFISGGIGVSFFFVLSGFILCYRYWDTFSNGVRANDFRMYFVARIARIYPLYVLALVLITGLYFAVVTIRPGAINFPANVVTSWLANLFALQTFAPTVATQQFWNAPSWSISTEFGFYLLLPFILALIAKYIRDTASLVLLLGFTIAMGIVAQATTMIMVLGFQMDRVILLDHFASRNIFWRLPEFVVGVITARLLYGGHLSWLSEKSHRNLLLAMSVAFVVALNLAPWPENGQSFMIMRQFRLDLGYMIPFACVVVSLAAGPTFLSNVLQRPFSETLGEASYGLYILHWTPWMGLTMGHAAGMPVTPAMTAIAIVLTVLFSVASFLWFERPLRVAIRQRFGR